MNPNQLDFKSLHGLLRPFHVQLLAYKVLVVMVMEFNLINV